MSKEKKYSIYVDLTQAEQDALKRFVAITGYKTVKHFVREALLEKISNDLKKKPQAEREAIEQVIRLPHNDDTSSLI